MPTGIELILADHRHVGALFTQLDAATPADPSIAGQVFSELIAHDEVEQHALYPLVAAVLDDDDLLSRSLRAHSEVKTLMEKARSLEGAPLTAMMALLRDAVQTHVADEEKSLLPALKTKATAAQLEGLASRIEAIKQRVG